MSNNKSLLQRINWINTPFLILMPLMGVIGFSFLIAQQAIVWPTLVFSLFLIFATGLSITCGYHRLFSHKTYQAKWPVRLMFALFGAAAFEGSIKEWSTDHRVHHRYTDTEKDPYNIKQGFWHAHILWLFMLDPEKRDFSNIADLCEDPIVAWQHKYYVPLAILMGIIFPIAVCALWGDWLGGLIIAVALRITFTHHGTFFINSVCHLFGKRTYSLRETARDNWVTALFTFGEGFHNFHHKFPLDYRNGIRYFHYDPSKWLIRALGWLGLASGLKCVSQKRIVECRLQVQEQQLREKISACQTLQSRFSHLIDPTKEAIMKAMQKIEEVEQALKHKALDNGVLVEYRQRLQTYRRELRQSLDGWMEIVKAVGA